MTTKQIPITSHLVVGLANYISFSRAILALGIVFMPRSNIASSVRLGLLLVIFFLDVLDGYVARKVGISNNLGGFIDICMDRVVELILWLYFASITDIPRLFPLLQVTRIWLVDLARLYLSVQGKQQATGVWLTGWRKTLVASKVSKGGYNILKLVAFVMLLWRVDQGEFAPAVLVVVLSILAIFSLIRGAPIIVQSIQFMQELKRTGLKNPADAQASLFVLQVIIDTVFLTWLMPIFLPTASR